MKHIRSVKQVIVPLTVMEGAGVRLKRSIATRQLNYLDPFLLFDHFGSDDPGDYLMGFPMHPHRGIETVTYMIAGSVDHKDSIGNSGSIGAGDVQWMTSGRGIMHEEMPKPVEGQMYGFQLWVNLPARLKMMQPRYQEIPSASIPEIISENGIKIRIIAGEADGVKGPVTEIAANPTYLDIALPADSEYEHHIEKDHAAFAYTFEGSIDYGSRNEAASPALVVFEDGDFIRATAGKDGGRFLLISGKPLGEPIARYGPFVMNTREEIEQALQDLRNGTFVR